MRDPGTVRSRGRRFSGRCCPSSVSRGSRRAFANGRSAFTLMELLLVLALVVGIAAMATPMLEGPMQNQRLRKGADQVRADWTTARNRAMKNGVTFVFHCRLGGSDYTIEPWYTEADGVELGAGQGGASGTAGQLVPYPMSESNQGSSLDTAVPLAIQKQLPENVMFIAEEVLADQRGALQESELSNLAPQPGSSRPVFFYPDGTSSDALLVLGNERQRQIRVQLRGLTGLSRASDLFVPEMSPLHAY